jgi:putative ABC transport system substrate-binding protein
MHPDDVSHVFILENVRSAAQRSRVEILPAEARTVHEIGSAFSMMSTKSVGAVIVNAGLLSVHRRHIAELAAKHRLPSVAAAVQYAEAGGLMSYGPDIIEPYRRAATYVDKILKGAKPGDMPVEQPTRFTLLVNGKSARTLGLTIPQSILVQATKVIE